MAEQFNILVSSAGRRVSLVRLLQESLRDLGLRGRVFAADLTNASSAMHAADRTASAPRFAGGHFIQDMLDLCKREGIKLLIPTIDTELPLYAAAKDRFQAIGTTVAVSSLQAIEICDNKKKTHQWLTGLDLPVPRQTTVAEAMESPSDWPAPLIVKPAHGSSSSGMTRIYQHKELAAISHPEVMVVESVARGDEFTIDVYIDREGNTRCAVPRQRLETRSGEVSKGMTVRDAQLQELAERIARELPDSFGVINIQIYKDHETDKLEIIEINPRFGGGYPLSHQAGAACTQWLIEECLDLPISVEPDVWRDGLVMLRYDDAVFVDQSDI